MTSWHHILKATYTTEATVFVSSKLHDKPLHFSCGLNSVSKGKLVHILRGSKKPLPLTFIVSATRNNGNDEHESAVGAYSDDQSLTVPNSSSESYDLEKEIVASSLYPTEDYSQHTQILGNHGNLLDKLKAVHMHALSMEQWNASLLKLCHRRHVLSAANLIHYLALRSVDVDQIKEDLSSVGLLNLETINPHVIASLSVGIQMLENLKSNSLDGDEIVKTIATDESFNKYTNRSVMIKTANSNRDFLIGPLQDERSHIMVTVGEEAVANETFIHDVLRKGATIIRINCAHGDPTDWSEIIRRVKVNSQKLEKPCRVLMDLAGPKLRTGRMKVGPCVMKISPKRNAYGNVINPAQVWVAQKGAGPPPAHVSLNAVIYVDGQEFLTNLAVGDTIRFSDARGKQRFLKISKKFPVFTGVGFMADCTKTCYVQNGSKLYIKGNKKRSSYGCVMDVPHVESFVRLKVGDLFGGDNDDNEDGGGVAVVGEGRQRRWVSGGDREARGGE
ncbi:plastidial pyruvate kinase 4, chloroplastic, partial [Tanacetum coccineum]